MQISYPEDKVHDIFTTIARGVNQNCSHCELEWTNFTNGEFQCFPGSPNQVTFRAKVHDRAQATAREVITHIEQWITSSDVVTLPVHHARLNINNTCIVLLASFDDPECPGYLTPPPVRTATYTMTSTTAQPSTSSVEELIPLSEPVYTTTRSTDDTYSSTESTTEQETTSAPTGTLSQNISTGSTSQPTATTNDQLTSSPQLTTGTLNQHQTAQNEEETVSPIDEQQLQFDAGAIVGGAVAIAVIITAGIVIMFTLYSVLKYRQTIKQLRYGTIAKSTLTGLYIQLGDIIIMIFLQVCIE